MPAQCIRYRNILGGRLAHAGRATAVQVSCFLRCENLFQNLPPAFRSEATATVQSARQVGVFMA